MKNKILCYIGARGNSKRLKRKNLQYYGKGDVTLLEWVIMNAIHSKVDNIVVDSEDEEILKVSSQYNVITHRRDKNLSEDDVSLYDAIRPVLEKNPEYNIIVILQVDNPVKNHEIIDHCIDVFLNHDDAEDVSTFHNNRRTGTVRVIKREYFFNNVPTANIYSVPDRNDFVDIHTQKDLEEANKYFDYPHHETFQVNAKICEPVKYNTKMILNHFNRYLKAIDYLDITEKDTVVDASCGQGYGSYILSLYADDVVGLDVNPKNIDYAYNHYLDSDLDFFTYGFFNEKRFADKIVCIETFEHIPKKDINKFVNNLFSMLSYGGNLFLTTPIGDDNPSNYNKHHLNEPSFDTLYNMFVPRFEQNAFITDKINNSFNKEQEYCLCIFKGFKK